MSTQESLISLKISLLTVHVLEIAESQDQDLIQDGIEVFLSPIAQQTAIGLVHDSLRISSSQTNDYWDKIPELLEMAEKDKSGIWQQTLWQVQGDYLIPKGMAFGKAAESISWEIYIEHEFADDLVSMSRYYWHLISVEVQDA